MPIPTAPDLIVIPFASSGDKTAPPQTDADGFVNFTNGYTADYEIDLTSGDASAKAVERKDQNYLFWLMTSIGQAWQEMSVAPWYSAMSGGYSKGALVGRVSAAGVWQIWRSTADANKTDPNASGQTAWEYVPFFSESIKSVAMPAGGVMAIAPGGQTTEQISTATDFNSLGTGIWEYISDTTANTSANAPIAEGATAAAAGMLECKTWTSGATSYGMQRYTTHAGISFVRGMTNGTWTEWTSSQKSPIDYSIDTGSANAIQGNASTTTLNDNDQFWIKVKTANTGATTFSPNTAISAKKLLGTDYKDLQGGELVADGRILVVYRASTDNFIMAVNAGGSQRALTATMGGQAVNLDQLNSAIGDYLPLAGGTMTGAIISARGLTGPSIDVRPSSATESIATTGDNTAPLRIIGNGSDNAAAFMAFQREGVYGAYFGLDSDNYWKVGGWNMGSNAYKIFHEGYTGFTSSDGNNGWIKYPDGHIDQWGVLTVNVDQGTSGQINFPISFPSACYNVIASDKITTPVDVNADCYVMIMEINQSYFTYYPMSPAGKTNSWNGMYWRAFGV